MKRTQLLFFATRADLEPVVRAIESSRLVKYVRAGLQNSSAPEVYGSALSLPSLGRAVKGDAVHEPAYLVVDVQEEVHVETIPQRRGGELYGVYPNVNPNSVTFSPGGEFDGCIIKGELATGNRSGTALDLFRLFEQEIRRSFKNIKGYRVGPTALAALDAGVRLTHDVGMSPLYDLRRK
jgi:hypothetical protein